MEEAHILELLKRADQAKQNAYAPYSGFRVGAAVMTKSGRIYSGCNVENASYGATVCAERVALFKAISEGERDFLAIAITSDGKEPAYPCGICRQVLCEFNPEMEVIVSGKDFGYDKRYKAMELFPHAFTGKDMDEG